MASQISTEIQVYHYLIHQDQAYLIEYSKVRTLVMEALPSPDTPALLGNTASTNYEILFLLAILLFLPVIVYLAYRYGKKIGEKEKKAPVGKNSDETDSSEETTNDTSEQEKKLGTTSGKEVSCLVPSNIFLNNIPQQNPQNQEITYPSKPLQPIESSEEKSTTASKERIILDESCASSGSQKKNEKNNIAKFQVVMENLFDSQDHSKKVSAGLNEERLKLHTHEDQVKTVEVKYSFSFERTDSGLQKIETQEVKTIYLEGAEEPESNALKLKNAYEAYQSPLLNQKQSVPSEKGLIVENPSTALVPFNTIQAVVPLKVQSPLYVVNKIEECKINIEKNCEMNLMLENKVSCYQKDEIPHETGKFAKIFKNVEIIGEGSFGKVYKVVHKLDGKVYAVKKARLKLENFEDLQQRSKVLREVFAMTDLHHPNIVRYSTCWVEIENQKEIPLKVGNMKNINEVQHESESIEEHASDYSESENSHTNTSSVGFEWDLGDQESQSDKAQKVTKEKKKQGSHGKKNRLGFVLKSMTKGFNTNNKRPHSLASYISETGQSENLGDYKLYLYIQMEYCSGQNLRDYLDTPKREVCSKKSLKMFRKILEGVYAIHKRGILHRDLKPANIFLDENENIKIGDFGLASLDNHEEAREIHGIMQVDGSIERSLSKQIGTPMYASPEQESGGKYNYKTDIYSLGLILSEMLAQLSTHHARYQLFKLIREKYDLPSDFRTKFSKESELILKMTAFNPEERPTVESLISEIDILLGDEILTQQVNLLQIKG